ncbi:MAG: D-glycero-alpha-D-manno-heptose-1,7-bisphosphate 7-phosphatase [Myxococcota bacterium]
MRPAAFLDRDGTLVEEVNYLARPEQLRLIPGVPEALLRLRAAGYALVLVTNQAGVARGYFGLDDVTRVHEALEAMLGLRFDGVYTCPHHPDFTGPCECRKPAPGLLLRAIAELGLDPARSFVVGDKRTDVLAGEPLGVRGYLVRTGHGAREGGDWADLAAVTDAVLA